MVMKISICVPQYNRINYLLKSLKQIEQQFYENIEIVVSDDCSSDDTESEILKLKETYKYPIIYSRTPVNCGYDRNYRRCIELATGDYCIVIGNDDTLYSPDSIQQLVSFLENNDYPEIGVCNFVEDNNRDEVVQRVHETKVVGKGKEVALKNYSCFSFVGGLIYQKKAFDRYNTEKHDGSIYSQMYLGCLMISSGCRLFTINEPLVLKDLNIGGRMFHSYRDKLARKWKDYKIVDGGLPSVINVLISAFRDAKVLDQAIIFTLFKRIYSITFPHWILDYKSNKAFPEAVGLIVGLNPLRNKNFRLLNIFNGIFIFCIYFFASFFALLTPSYLFTKFKNRVYKFLKK
jgi:glycosyltransferase involved in cell wall biosynthesis